MKAKIPANKASLNKSTLRKGSLQKNTLDKSTLHKTSLHIKNRHRHGYNFNTLAKAHPELTNFIIKNKFNGQATIDFSNANAVKSLNLALLKKDYQIDDWEIPQGFLCPPIPGRVDYIHYLADLLNGTQLSCEQAKLPVTVLDIGTGASCIYPILGQREYNWNFVATDIDKISIKFANKNIQNNNSLSHHVNCRLQANADHIFTGIIQENEFYHLTMCNPPFHKSLAEASQGTQQKWQKLNKSAKQAKPKDTSNLNFGGQKAELWCKGGELAFIRKMIKESKYFQKQVLWFTCLVSKKDNLSQIKLSLKKAKVSDIKVIKMAQGQKISRFIAWSYLVEPK